MVYALHPFLMVLFLDAPHSRQGGYIQYDFLEEVKNGYVFSKKYESEVKIYAPIHVVVNINKEPDRTKLSPDRYHVINIGQFAV
jgi:hypothetical protein